VTDDQDNKLEN